MVFLLWAGAKKRTSHLKFCFCAFHNVEAGSFHANCLHLDQDGWTDLHYLFTSKIPANRFYEGIWLELSEGAIMLVIAINFGIIALFLRNVEVWTS